MCGGKGSKGAASQAGASSTTAASVVAFVSLLLVVASVLAFFLSPPPGDGKARAPPEPVELAIAGAGHEGRHGWLGLGALRAWARLRLRPLQPRGELRSPGESVVAKAAKRSLEMGKETVEHTAESAARAAEDTLGRTTEKVRRKVVSSSPARRADGDL